jgi:hypothetical protein
MSEPVADTRGVCYSVLMADDFTCQGESTGAQWVNDDI